MKLFNKAIALTVSICFLMTNVAYGDINTFKLAVPTRMKDMEFKTAAQVTIHLRQSLKDARESGKDRGELNLETIRNLEGGEMAISERTVFASKVTGKIFFSRAQTGKIIYSKDASLEKAHKALQLALAQIRDNSKGWKFDKLKVTFTDLARPSSDIRMGLNYSSLNEFSDLESLIESIVQWMSSHAMKLETVTLSGNTVDITHSHFDYNADADMLKKLKRIDEVIEEIEGEMRRDGMEDYFTSVNGRRPYSSTSSGGGWQVMHNFQEMGLLRPDKKFGDVGAGIGMMLILAALTDVGEIIGFEYDSKLVKYGKKAIQILHDEGVIDASKIRWIEGDWRDHQDEIPKLDAVYTYPPILENSEFENWTLLIRLAMKSSAYFYDGHKPEDNGYGLIKVSPSEASPKTPAMEDETNTYIIPAEVNGESYYCLVSADNPDNVTVLPARVLELAAKDGRIKFTHGTMHAEDRGILDEYIDHEVSTYTYTAIDTWIERKMQGGEYAVSYLAPSGLGSLYRDRGKRFSYVNYENILEKERQFLTLLGVKDADAIIKEKVRMAFVLIPYDLRVEKLPTKKINGERVSVYGHSSRFATYVFVPPYIFYEATSKKTWSNEVADAIMEISVHEIGAGCGEDVLIKDGRLENLLDRYYRILLSEGEDKMRAAIEEDGTAEHLKNLKPVNLLHLALRNDYAAGEVPEGEKKGMFKKLMAAALVGLGLAGLLWFDAEKDYRQEILNILPDDVAIPLTDIKKDYPNVDLRIVSRVPRFRYGVLSTVREALDSSRYKEIEGLDILINEGMSDRVWIFVTGKSNKPGPGFNGGNFYIKDEDYPSKLKEKLVIAINEIAEGKPDEIGPQSPETSPAKVPTIGDITNLLTKLKTGEPLDKIITLNKITLMSTQKEMPLDLLNKNVIPALETLLKTETDPNVLRIVKATLGYTKHIEASRKKLIDGIFKLLTHLKMNDKFIKETALDTLRTDMEFRGDEIPSAIINEEVVPALEALLKTETDPAIRQLAKEVLDLAKKAGTPMKAAVTEISEKLWKGEPINTGNPAVDNQINTAAMSLLAALGKWVFPKPDDMSIRAMADRIKGQDIEVFMPRSQFPSDSEAFRGVKNGLDRVFGDKLRVYTDLPHLATMIKNPKKSIVMTVGLDKDEVRPVEDLFGNLNDVRFMNFEKVDIEELISQDVYDNYIQDTLSKLLVARAITREEANDENSPYYQLMAHLLSGNLLKDEIKGYISQIANNEMDPVVKMYKLITQILKAMPIEAYKTESLKSAVQVLWSA